jgi:hypothetical protein
MPQGPRAFAFLLASAASSCGGHRAPSSNADGSAPAIRVLFLGNSYTYVNDLPDQVRKLAASAAPAQEIRVDSVAVGGARLSDLYATSDALKRIRAGGWTHVVIQGQSIEPVWPLTDPSGFQDYATRFGLEANAVGAMPVYYETWARRADDPVYEQVPGLTPASMQAELRDGYRQAAWKVGGAMAPVGDAWELALAEPGPPVDLFMSDGSHPNARGTHLAACIFFGVLTGRTAVGLGAVPSEVTGYDAHLLQSVADRACVGRACARRQTVGGSGSLVPRSSSSCTFDGCLYLPESCSIQVMTAGSSDLYSGPATFAADCELRLTGSSGPVGPWTSGSGPPTAIPVTCRDFHVHSTSFAGVVGGGAGTPNLIIDGSGPFTGNPRTQIEGRYSMSFRGTVDGSATEVIGTTTLMLDQACTLSGSLTLR